MGDLNLQEIPRNCFLTVAFEKFRDVYKSMRKEHQDALYEKLRKQQTVLEMKEERRLEEGLKPKQTLEELMEKARLILPQIVNLNKDSGQGLIDIAEMRRLLKIPHNIAYNLRKELLKDLHAEDDKLLAELRRAKKKQ